MTSFSQDNTPILLLFSDTFSELSRSGMLLKEIQSYLISPAEFELQFEWRYYLKIQKWCFGIFSSTEVHKSMKLMCNIFGSVTVKNEDVRSVHTHTITLNWKKLWQINAHISKSFLFKSILKKAPNVYMLKDNVCTI